jgi:hypothetical protein
LKFRFEGFLKKLAPFGEKECVKVIKGLTVGGGVGNLIALRKEGFEFRVKEGVNFGRGKPGFHHYVRVKGKSLQTIVLIPTN